MTTPGRDRVRAEEGWRPDIVQKGFRPTTVEQDPAPEPPPPPPQDEDAPADD